MNRSALRNPIYYLVVLLLISCAVSLSVHADETTYNDSFYTAPSPLPGGSHGDLIRYRAAEVIIPSAPSFDAWNVMYLSTDALGNPNAVTGTVVIPRQNCNDRILSYAVGTHGLSHMCAASEQLTLGTDYENSNFAAVLRAGYILLVTDNAGFTNGDVPSYMVGLSQGHACLDIITASKQIPSIGIDEDADVAIWGYSQGGQTACWAGQLQPDYLPDINLVGVAAGGVPADLIETGYNIDGKVGSSFLLQVVMGLWSQYPDQVPLYELANDKGKAAMDLAQEVCVFGALFEFMKVELSEYVTGNPSLEELIDTYVRGPLEDQKLGDMKIKAPVYLYHGTADEFIPLDPALQLKEDYCHQFMNVTFGVYPGEHIITQFQAAPYVLDWMNDRFEGKLSLGTCVTLKDLPVADHNPLTGDFIVSMKEWQLIASMHLNTLDQDVFMPEESTYTVDSNMDTNTVTGDLNIPDWAAPIKVVLPLKVGLLVQPAYVDDEFPDSSMAGAVELDDVGNLHIHGHQYVNIAVEGLGLTGLTAIPIKLVTEEPVDFPIDFDGPISSLGDGSLLFTGETTFPPMTGGMFDTLFTVLMSGPGQTYSYNVVPPEPTTW